METLLKKCLDLQLELRFMNRTPQESTLLGHLSIYIASLEATKAKDDLKKLKKAETG
jgi:hypothetical protein